MRTAILSLLLATAATAGPPTLGNGYSPPLTFQATTSLGNCALTWNDAKQQWIGTCPATPGVEPLNLFAYVIDTGDIRGASCLCSATVVVTQGVAPSTSAVDFGPFKCRLLIEPSGFDGFSRYRTKITGTVTE